MLDHLIRECTNAPDNLSKACGDQMSNKINEAVGISTPAVSTTSKLSIPSSTSFIKMHFTPRLPQNNLDRYQDEHTVSFIECNIPWSVLDNQRFRRTKEVLRPGLNHLTAANAPMTVLDRLNALQVVYWRYPWIGLISLALI